MTRNFRGYSLPLAVVLFRMYLHDCVSCMMPFKNGILYLSSLLFSNSDNVIHWMNGFEIKLAAFHQVKFS